MMMLVGWAHHSEAPAELPNPNTVGMEWNPNSLWFLARRAHHSLGIRKSRQKITNPCWASGKKAERLHWRLPEVVCMKEEQ